MRVTSLNGVPMHGDYNPRLHDADCAYLAQLHLPDRTLIWFPVHGRRASSGQRPCHPQPGDPRGLIRTTKPGHAVVQLSDASNGASVGVPPHMLLHHPQLHHADWKDALVRLFLSHARDVMCMTTPHTATTQVCVKGETLSLRMLFQRRHGGAESKRMSSVKTKDGGVPSLSSVLASTSTAPLHYATLHPMLPVTPRYALRPRLPFLWPPLPLHNMCSRCNRSACCVTAHRFRAAFHAPSCKALRRTDLPDGTIVRVKVRSHAAATHNLQHTRTDLEHTLHMAGSVPSDTVAWCATVGQATPWL